MGGLGTADRGPFPFLIGSQTSTLQPMPAADCEFLADGFLAQPINAVSSLAFVMGGFLLFFTGTRGGFRGPLAAAFSATLVAVGIGSVAFHGPGGVVADWVHDGSITALLVLIATAEIGSSIGWNQRRMVSAWAVVSAMLWSVEWIWSGAGDTLNAPLAAFAVVGVLATQRSTAAGPDEPTGGILVGLTILGLGGLIMLLSRTGGPLCAPNSVLQGHAIWHVLAAIGIFVYARFRAAAAARPITATPWPTPGR